MFINMRDRNFQINSIKIQERMLVGHGSTLYSALVSESDERLVAKYSKKDFVNREVMAYESIPPHANILPFYGSMQNECLFLKQAEFGDLQRKLSSCRRFSEEISRRFFIEILEGLQHIHKAGWVHNDLRLENMLITQEFVLKIADFGRSSSTDLPTIGPYIAPERLQDQNNFSSKSDVFSCGVILFTMVVGKFPFRLAQRYDTFFQLLSTGQFDKFWKPFGKFDEEFKNIIHKMLSIDPVQRLTVEESLSHPWMKQPFASVEKIAKLFN